MFFKPRDEFKRVEKLRRATKPLFVVGRLVGLVPCNDEFLVTTFWLIYSIVVCSVLVLASVLLKTLLDLYYEVNSDRSNLSFILDYMRSVPFNICLLSHAVALWLHRRDFQKLLTGLKELTDVKDSYFFATYVFWYVVFKASPSWGMLIYQHGSILNRATLDYAAQEIPSLMFCLIETIFCLCLELIRHELKRLLSDMHPNYVNLTSLTKRHYLCIELACLANDLFSYQLLIMCTGIFINLVLSVYDCIVCLKIDDLISALNSATECIRQAIILFTLAYSCEETKEKADEFNDTLFKMMRESKELCSNEKLHLYVTMKHTINFSACGFFFVGYPLVTSILAAATTYLVILVQFNLDH